MGQTVHDIRAFGAVGDGETVNTDSVQRAIDSCSRQGGGTVSITGGQYVIGTIVLKDNVVLNVETGAALLGSTKIADYAKDTHKNMYKNEPHMDRCLIFARGAKNIAIVGNGTIDGRGGVGRIGDPGSRQNFPNQDDPQRNRPMLIRLLKCSKIRIRDVTLQNPAAWTSAMLYCNDIVADGITISSRTNRNGDGLDFDGCRNVRVSNCAFDTSDDAICLQASRKDRPCQDVTINNCIFVSKWAGIRIGLLSIGDFENVAVTNCVFRDIDDSGLKIQMCEGGTMQNMVFSNLVMHNVPRPIFMTFCQQRACVDSPKDQLMPMKAMRGFVFSSIRADSTACGVDSAIVITGMPGHPIEDIQLSNIQLKTGGGASNEIGTRRNLNELSPEVLEGWWPEYTRLGATVPAHGIYARHVTGLSINNLSISTAEPDQRPTIVCDDVAELNINDVSMQGNPSSGASLRLQNVVNAIVKNCRVSGPCKLFALVEDSPMSKVDISKTNYVGSAELVKGSAP